MKQLIPRVVISVWSSAVLILCCISGTAQEQKSPEPPVPWFDHWRYSPFSFGHPETDDTSKRQFFKVIGTGFIVTTDEHTAYFATAKHVFDDSTKNWHPRELRLRFAWQERQSVYDYLGTTLPLFSPSGHQLWLASDDGADIAVIPVTDVSELGLIPGVNPHGIDISDIGSADDYFEGASLFVVGYPGVVGNEYLVRSIARYGAIAWLNPDDPYGKSFLIDANIYPGNSGGPVIRIPVGIDKYGRLNPGGTAHLLGVVSKAPGIEQDVSLTVPGYPLPLHLRQSLPLGGTGVIEPAFNKVAAILNRLAAAGAH
jgi:hypothetical protein